MCTTQTYTTTRGNYGGILKCTVYMLNDVYATQISGDNDEMVKLKLHMFKVTPFN